MVDSLQSRIIEHLKSEEYRPVKPRGLARELNLHQDEQYHAFRDALRELMNAGRVVLGGSGAIVLPSQKPSKDEFTGTYRHNKRGFGFVVPTDPASREDLFIPEGQNGGAITGDIVRAKIVNREQREGRTMSRGRITEILQRTQKRFVGTLNKMGNDWLVMPDGNTLTDAVRTPDAASRHIRPGTKVVVELTTYPAENQLAQGVITEVLGEAGEKDVDLKSIIIQHNLPGDFPDAVKDEARVAVDEFDPANEAQHRFDLSDEIICTIDPDDAKDYDDAISLRQLKNGHWELGVHIADVSHFVKPGTALDEEARARGNSAYFPGFVIPMLPEVLSNGVCSLQEGVPRLCKSAFITYDEDAQPVQAKFANTIIKSRKRLRYTEAQALIDGKTEIPHPDGVKTIADYDSQVLEHLLQMNTLAKRLQRRRQQQGQLVLDLPEVDLVLDQDGKVIDAVPEDQSFTHTLIEMFMVEANEAVARLFDSQDLPFLRRVHPEPDLQDSERLKHFAEVTGHRLGKTIDRKSLQTLLTTVKGRPEAFAINLAVLRSLTRAEYSPEVLGHFALASQHYAHFTSPIRRYADLTIHRLLDSYLEAREIANRAGGKKKRKLELDNVVPYDELVELGRHISFTERRAEDAERELRQVKILSLLKNHIGEEYLGVVTGIANFGIFIQLNTWLVDGVIRYEDLMDDWWDVDTRSGMIRGERTGKRIGIGDVVKVIIVTVDLARRELSLAISELLGRPGGGAPTMLDKGKPGRPNKEKKPTGKGGKFKPRADKQRGGESRRNRASKGRGRRK
jgi:ribonuclease R